MRWLYYTSNSNHENASRKDEPELLKVEKLDSVSIINGDFLQHEHEEEEENFNDLDMEMFTSHHHHRHHKGILLLHILLPFTCNFYLYWHVF